jgi:hypothetical protein
VDVVTLIASVILLIEIPWSMISAIRITRRYRVRLVESRIFRWLTGAVLWVDLRARALGRGRMRRHLLGNDDCFDCQGFVPGRYSRSAAPCWIGESVVSTDMQDVMGGQDRPVDPDDIARRAYYAAALGLLRSIRLIVLFILGLEIYGRVAQTLYLLIPTFGAH